MVSLDLLPLEMLLSIAQFVGACFLLCIGPRCSRILSIRLSFENIKIILQKQRFPKYSVPITMLTKNDNMTVDIATFLLPFIKLENEARDVLSTMNILNKYQKNVICEWYLNQQSIQTDKKFNIFTCVFHSACATGNLDLIQWYVSNFSLAWTEFTDNNFIAFDLSCLYGNDDMIEWLIYTIIPPYVNIFTRRGTTMNHRRGRGGQGTHCLPRSFNFQIYNQLKKYVDERRHRLTELSFKLARFKLDVKCLNFQCDNAFYFFDFFKLANVFE